MTTRKKTRNGSGRIAQFDGKARVPNTTMTADMERRIKAFAKREEKRRRSPVSMAEVIRHLLDRGLEAERKAGR